MDRKRFAKIYFTLGIGLTFMVGTITGRLLHKVNVKAFAVLEDQATPGKVVASLEGRRPTSEDEDAESFLTQSVWGKCTDLQMIPTSVLKAEYEKRVGGETMERWIGLRFSTSENSPTGAGFYRSLSRHLNPFYKATPFWRGRVDIPMGDVVAEFDVILRVEDPKERKDSRGDVIPYLDYMLFVSINQKSYKPTITPIGRLQDIRKSSDGGLYVVGEVNSKPLNRKYSRFAVSLPQPDELTGYVELLEMDTGRWVKVEKVFDWISLNEEETSELLGDSPY